MKTITVCDLNGFLTSVSQGYTVYAPIEKAGVTDFHKWNGQNVDFTTLKTAKSAKNLFFPQVENLMHFKTDGKSLEVKQNELLAEKFVVFGVRACDAKAFEVLDRVFLADPVDEFYSARREHGTVIALTCNEPEESCFCSTFGVDATAPNNCDVVATEIGGKFVLKSVSEKGDALLELANADVATDADLAKVEENAVKSKEITAKLPFANLDLTYFKETDEKEIFFDKRWNDIYNGCLACGTCTFVCPTCQCFDVRDFKADDKIIRYRCWDSCMYSDFTQMAHGNNRTSQMQRFRQRFMHKLVYYPANNDGLFSCVGCGRCVEKCPQKLNIVKVIKKMGGKNE